MQAILDEAIEQYRRNRFFRELNESSARLQADPKGWEEAPGERRFWDATNTYGLERE